MNDRQKIGAIALGVCLFLFLALVAGFKLALTGSAPLAPPPPVAETPAASAPATAPAASENKVLTRLIAVQAALQQASDALGKAGIKNHGGFVQQGRTSIHVALEDANAALAYLAEHPEQDAFQPTTDICSVRPVEIPSYDIRPDGSNVSPNLAHALTALNEALAQMMQPRGSEHPISAAMDGARDKIIDDIDQTAKHVLSAYEFGERGAAPPAPETAPATPATATRP